MKTIIEQPGRILTVIHKDYVKVLGAGDRSIIVSREDECKCCEPQMLTIESEENITIELVSNP